MIVWSRRLVCAAMLAILFYILAVWAPSQASGDPTTTAASSSAAVMPAAHLVDGHDVDWWARRARRNGDRVRTLQATLRAGAGVGFGARRLAGVTSSPDGLVRAFLCIRRFEASWRDGGKPYYGGLQMDSTFASHYGDVFVRAWGTPDRWPPFVQLTVAMNAYLSGRGFWPWPNTARECGLLR